MHRFASPKARSRQLRTRSCQQRRHNHPTVNIANASTQPLPASAYIMKQALKICIVDYVNLLNIYRNTAKKPYIYTSKQKSYKFTYENPIFGRCKQLS